MKHLIIKDNAAYCKHCLQSDKTIFMPGTTLGAIKAKIKDFELAHKDCQPQECQPEIINARALQEEYDNALHWLAYGEKGMSSMTIFNKLCGDVGLPRKNDVSSSFGAYPYDSGDFARCWKLLEAVPQWRRKMKKIASISPIWAKIVENWATLSDLHESEKQEEINKILIQCRKD